MRLASALCQPICAADYLALPATDHHEAIMARYFFHVHRGGSVHRDVVGQEMESVDAVCAAALKVGYANLSAAEPRGCKVDVYSGKTTLITSLLVTRPGLKLKANPASSQVAEDVQSRYAPA